MNRILEIRYPPKVVFGEGCIASLTDDLARLYLDRVLIVTVPPLLGVLKPVHDAWTRKGMRVTYDVSIAGEPLFEDYLKVLDAAGQDRPQAVIGVGGGSVMDVAKLVAAQLTHRQSVDEFIGSGRLPKRDTLLVCVPTTAGTGSEASPNAIFVDGRDGQKKGVISPELVPDAVYVDPALAVTLPPQVTAATGLDALSHCIEAYTNRFAHPMVDLYALEGIRLISSSLARACRDGTDMDARSAMALGSFYGGVCLGPVNTAAVHALSYPLGCRFHVAHGLSNAILLPHVMRYNQSAAPERYAAVAMAMGAKAARDQDLPEAGVLKVIELMRHCRMPLTMSALDIPEDVIPLMAEEAIQITRLLKNNPREVGYRDALDIYHAAY